MFPGGQEAECRVVDNTWSCVETSLWLIVNHVNVCVNISNQSHDEALHDGYGGVAGDIEEEDEEETMRDDHVQDWDQCVMVPGVHWLVSTSQSS